MPAPAVVAMPARIAATLALLAATASCAPRAASPIDEWIEPGAALAVEGVPRIPRALADRVGAYTEYRGQRFLDWHPDRKEMLVAQRAGETLQLFRLPGPGLAAEQLTAFDERVASGTYPPGDPSYVVLARDEQGDERYRLYRFDLATRQAIAFSAAGRRARFGAWARPAADEASHLLAYTAVPTATRAESSTLRTEVRFVDPRNPASDRLVASLPGIGWSIRDVSADRATVLLGEYRSAGESYLWLLDAASATKRLLTPRREAEPGAYVGGALSPTGERVFALGNHGREFLRLVAIDVRTRDQSVIAAHDWSIDGFALSHDGSRLAYRTNEDGTSVLRVLDLAAGVPIALPLLPRGVIRGLGWHRDNRTLAFNLSSAQDTLAAYALDTAGGTLARWSESPRAGADPAAFVAPELVRWKSFDGREISGYLTAPPARFGGRRPVIVEVHGGPESQARPGFLGRANYLVNELGIAILHPNVRGSTGYGKTFMALDDGLRREDAVKDLGAALDWIGAHPRLDAGRIMVSGASYGGYMSLAAATRYAERIACAVSEVGIANFVTFLENTESYRRDLRRSEYGDERDPAMRRFLESISPLSQAARIKRPLLIVHGTNDPRVPVSEAHALLATVRGNGVPVWSIIAGDEGHGFSKKANMDYLFLATVLFAERCFEPVRSATTR